VLSPDGTPVPDPNYTASIILQDATNPLKYAD